MPEKPLTIATYALGASLAAISLFYVFGPTFALDADPLSSYGKQRRIVGLDNPANMCFVNSVLQALANSPELRRYLIRETHRRRLDGKDVYNVRIEDVEGTGRAAANNQIKQDDLQHGIVTQGLKIMLDRLNERPLNRKTISAHDFIVALETAFRTRISRQQQDAQEFLQLVLERLDDEYHAGKKARDKKIQRQRGLSESGTSNAPSVLVDSVTSSTLQYPEESIIQEDTVPFEGKLEGQIRCEKCGFEPKPSTSVFVTLTLNVPLVSSTTLNKCFDGLLKNENIEDFKCDKCKLMHAQEVKSRRAASTTDQFKKASLLSELSIINHALAKDPEASLPESIKMPSNPPLSTISRSMRISTYPQVLSIHLSRSMFSNSSYASKNTARVSFPESLRVGGLQDFRYYALSSAVMHKGGHNSGHYETFRRQAPMVPFSTPNTLGSAGPYSQTSSPFTSANNSSRDGMTPSPVGTEGIESVPESATFSVVEDPLNLPSSTTSLSDGRASPSSHRSSSFSSFRVRRAFSTSKKLHQPPAPTSAPSSSHATHTTYTSIPETPTNEQRMSRMRRLERKIARNQGPEGDEDRRRLAKRRRRLAQRWWRVSDEKVKECRTSDVLGMQREVYLLFYELDESQEFVGHKEREKEKERNGEEFDEGGGVRIEMRNLVDRTMAR
jgi:ubiquitin carboxyl-terminal hydrolase 16